MSDWTTLHLKALSLWAVRLGLGVSFAAYINGDFDPTDDNLAAFIITTMLFLATVIPAKYYDRLKIYLKPAARFFGAWLFLSFIAFSSAVAGFVITAKTVPSLASIFGVSQIFIAAFVFTIVAAIAYPALPERLETFRRTGPRRPGNTPDVNKSEPEVDAPPIVPRAS
ncbi:hypothetical protein KVR01_012571 [Diaporthe batatas]|uniref:uncharacterized protein n=1 Tax=Diaporthe batatas TaxID=748121 RepID=UPI001D04D020|nr:uncharacterized protein KVR01_012571 [Diaporthe batatas]KAG8157529.1 hypothetical protein KVR01_012571 [Diaporthe batatas]